VGNEKRVNAADYANAPLRFVNNGASIMKKLALAIAVFSNSALAQSPAPSVLEIQLANQVEYVQDDTNPSSFATDPRVTTPSNGKNFTAVTILADIVSVNGQAVKGVYVGRTRRISLNPHPAPGEAIADVTRAALREGVFDILKSDGTPIGSLIGVGLNGGPAPPGAPASQTAAAIAIVGGTGAFLGARGELGGSQRRGSPIGRLASMSEDPANRRLHGGFSQLHILTVIPMTVPQIASLHGPTAVFHSGDSSIVTAATPAAPGEVLSMHASNLGPTVPSVHPGKPFPASPPAAVNSPLDILVNGRPAEVISAFGIPGTVDSYEVKFRIPEDTAKGPASIRIVAAWIEGPAATVPIN
jgi:hypothetical protein